MRGHIPVAVGEAVVIWLTFAHVDVAHTNAGIIGLGINAVVGALAHLAEMVTGVRSRDEEGRQPQAEPVPQR